MRCFILVVWLLGTNLFAVAQTNKEALKALPKDSLIKRAEKAIKKTYPDFRAEAYDRIVLKESNNDLGIDFSHSVRLVPYKRNYYYDVWYTFSGKIDVTNDNYRDNGYPEKFFKPSRKSKKKIAFIFKTINKSEKVGHFKENKIPSGSQMLIYEGWWHYRVEMKSYSTHSRYSISKITGRISRASHKHYARFGEEKEPEFKTIVW